MLSLCHTFWQRPPPDPVFSWVGFSLYPCLLLHGDPQDLRAGPYRPLLGEYTDTQEEGARGVVAGKFLLTWIVKYPNFKTLQGWYGGIIAF